MFDCLFIYLFSSSAHILFRVDASVCFWRLWGILLFWLYTHYLNFVLHYLPIFSHLFHVCVTGGAGVGCCLKRLVLFFYTTLLVVSSATGSYVAKWLYMCLCIEECTNHVWPWGTVSQKNQRMYCIVNVRDALITSLSPHRDTHSFRHVDPSRPSRLLFFVFYVFFDSRLPFFFHLYSMPLCMCLFCSPKSKRKPMIVSRCFYNCPWRSNHMSLLGSGGDLAVLLILIQSVVVVSGDHMNAAYTLAAVALRPISICCKLSFQ